VRRIAVFGALDREIRGIRKGLFNPLKISTPGLVGWSGHIGQVEVILISTGMGPTNAGSVSRKTLIEFSPEIVFSIGFASALRSELAIGDLILSEELVQVSLDGEIKSDVFFSDQSIIKEYMGDRRWVTSPTVPSASSEDIDREKKTPLKFMKIKEDIHLYYGMTLSVDQMIRDSGEKNHLATCHHALGLDMESATVAQEAKTFNIPFFSIRAVSDLRNEDLNVDFEQLIHPDGSFRYVSGIFYILTHPKIIHNLNRLSRQTLLASKNLSIGVLQFLKEY